MPENNSVLLYDQKVLPAVIELVEQAKSQVVLVSPYNEYSVPLREAVARAAKRTGVRVIAVCRADMADKEHDHLAWLKSIGATVYLVERLHSKIYLNERQAVVTSMNLTKGSAVDSREIGFLINDPHAREEITSYVRVQLIQSARPWLLTAPVGQPAMPRAQRSTPRRSTQASPVPPTTVGGLFKAILTKATAANQQGACISCGTKIAFNTDKPFCLDCFHKWNKDKDEDARQGHCHDCGQRRSVSFAKPLCSKCYKNR